MSGQFSSAYARQATEGRTTVESSSPGLANLDIASLWVFPGTNNSALRYNPPNQFIPSDFTWSTRNVNLHPQKRHWSSEDSGYKEDDSPPNKVHINEEKVAMQFNNMSLHPSEHRDGLPYTTTTTMWKHYHHLEQQLEQEAIDVDRDEGVDMGPELDEKQSVTAVVEDPESHRPSLYICPEIKTTIAEPVPQIMVPKPCSEVVLWKPSGVDFLLKDTLPPPVRLASDGDSESRGDSGGGSGSGGGGSASTLNVIDCMKASRKKKSAVRSLSANSVRLFVPVEVRPNTPPPNNKAPVICEDISVCFVEESSPTVQNSNNMEL